MASALDDFLKKRAHLSASEIPWVASTFLAVKYLTWCGFVAGGIRYKPLTRLFRTADFRSRAKDAFDVSLKNNADNMSMTSNTLRRFNSYNKDFKRGKAKELHKTDHTWFEYAGMKYSHYSKVFAEKMQKNKTFNNFSSIVGIHPKDLALGVAEGMLLYKATFLLHAPLELFLVVKWAQARSKRWILEDERKTEEKGEKSVGESVGEAVGDMIDLVGIAYVDEGDGSEEMLQRRHTEARESQTAWRSDT
jgi:hypothetical protein